MAETLCNLRKRGGGSANGMIMVIEPGQALDFKGRTLTFPYSESVANFTMMINVKGYSTLTTNGLTHLWIDSVNSDGSITNLKNNVSLSSFDVSTYDYIWLTHYSTSAHSVTVGLNS